MPEKVQFKKIKLSETAENYLVQVIIEHLDKDETVTWLVAGGSVVSVAVKASYKLASQNLSRLFVTLTDERYVPAKNPDSNWQQLLDAGWHLPGANLFPILKNEDIENTTSQYDRILHKVLDGPGYKIGLFGIGPDGHIAALFPHSPQLEEEKLYAVYLDNSPKPPSKRLTMTLSAIQKLDEAIIFAMGPGKKPAIQNLTKDLPIDLQPAQVLKKLPKLTIFNNQIGEAL